MIFEKEANFPYPILSKNTTDYMDKEFILKVGVIDEKLDYIFKIEYTIESEFLKNLISNNRAAVYLIIQSKDSKFYELKTNEVRVSKKSITLSKRTKFQLFVVTIDRISMANNLDLDQFFDVYKKNIFLDPNSVLAISNIEKFDGDIKKPYDLFELKHNNELESEIRIVLGGESSEMIQIQYRDHDYVFENLPYKSKIRYIYVYMGLHHTLTKMIKDDAHKDDFITVEEYLSPSTPLYKKIQNLLSAKNIEEVNYENIDMVISKISDSMIEKYANAVGSLVQDENN